MSGSAGFCYLIRRVPRRFAAQDTRGIVKLSTYIRIADDPNAIAAAPIAAQLGAAAFYASTDAILNCVGKEIAAALRSF